MRYLSFSERTSVRKRTTARRTDKFTESSLAMIIFGVQGIIFPLELFPRFILHRASPPFCSRYIFSSPLLVQLAVQGRNLLETSFLSTSSPLRLPFNLFLQSFLHLRFRSSRSSSSSCIFSPDLFLVHSNFFLDLAPLVSHLFIPLVPKTFPPHPLVALLSLSFLLFPFFTLSNASRSENFTTLLLRFTFIFSFLFFSWYRTCTNILQNYFYFPYYILHLFISSYLWTISVSFSRFTFARSFHREIRLVSSVAAHLRPSSRRFLFEVSCPPGSAITSSYPVVWSRGGRVPFLVVVTNPFCAVHVQSSWRAIITKWTKRKVLLTSSWHEPCGPSLGISRKTCLHFYFFANVRR